jgi:hypothetical protein
VDRLKFINTEWNDTDDDGIGDNSDPDIDGDGYLNIHDDLPFNPSEWKDTDGDGKGNNIDFDDDNDGANDEYDDFPTDPSEQTDFDDDGIGDNTDADIDGDGWLNIVDDYPFDGAHWVRSKDQDELSTTELLLAVMAILLAILILVNFANILRRRAGIVTEPVGRESREAPSKLEEKIKSKSRKSDEMARCSECGKIIPMSSERCPRCGLEFED